MIDSASHRRSTLLPALTVIISVLLNACTTVPLEPYTEESPPYILIPATQAGVVDKRGRFREIFCSILRARGTKLPDFRPCDEALTRIGDEPEGTGRTVALGHGRRPLVAVIVPGLGWHCFSSWLDINQSVVEHVQQFGYDLRMSQVGSLSSTPKNARLIRDAIMDMQATTQRNLVLIGYSKGAPDILQAVVAYPEIHSRIAAVISVAGAIGGSPLANHAKQSQAELLRHWPGAQCDIDGGGVVESLRPIVRKK
ncbi:hypothetical protein [Pseudomaricurvus hydrocarbonicus]|uniref:hypothetical protein n=1 Tax=Pseudomaricurvus hydrocarbonicus TaxID=1470433 RepID=UPI001AA0A636|nr:hypothetical protein [Aestuariicella hydrocarbonica]